MDEYSSFPIQHPFDHSADPTQLYNNEKNATECNTMQQISPKILGQTSSCASPFEHPSITRLVEYRSL